MSGPASYQQTEAPLAYHEVVINRARIKGQPRPLDIENPVLFTQPRVYEISCARRGFVLTGLNLLRVSDKIHEPNILIAAGLELCRRGPTGQRFKLLAYSYQYEKCKFILEAKYTYNKKEYLWYSCEFTSRARSSKNA